MRDPRNSFDFAVPSCARRDRRTHFFPFASFRKRFACRVPFFLFPRANAFVKIDAFATGRENVRFLSPRCNRALNRSFAATAT